MIALEDGEGSAFALSSQQRAVMARDAYAGRVSVLIASAELPEHTDSARLRSSIEQAVARHEVLRTRYRKLPGLHCPVQIPSTGRLHSVREWSGENSSFADIAEALTSQIDLKNGPVSSFGLVREAGRPTRLVAAIPRVTADRPAVAMLLEEILGNYAGISQNEPPELQYVDYAEWQRGLSGEEPSAKATAFWRHAEQEAHGGAVRWHGGRTGSALVRQPVRADHDLENALRHLAEESGLGAEDAALFCWAVFLARIHELSQVCIGVTQDARDDSVAGVLGRFESLVPMAIPIDAASTVRRNLSTFAARIDDCRMWLPYFQPPDSGEVGELQDFRFGFRSEPPPAVQHAIEIEVEEACDAVLGLEYRSAERLVFVCREGAFDARTLTLWAAQFAALISELARDPAQIVSDVPMRAPEDRRLQLSEFNVDTDWENLPVTLVHRLIERRAADEPDALALLFDAQRVSYDELNRRSNRLARKLRTLGVGPDVLVGLCADRSTELVVAVLAVLKAGGGYVPIDPSYPPERIAYMVQNARPCVLLTQSRLAAALPPTGAQMLCLDVGADVGSSLHDDSNLADSPHPRNAAYCIYTSGSTGRPKGCVIEHRSFSNYVRWASDRYFGEGRGGSFGLYSSLSFDLTVTSLFVPLVRGKSLRIFREGAPVDEVLRDTLAADAGVDAIKLTPSHIAVLRQMELPPTRADVAIVGGEALLLEHIRDLHRLNPQMRVYNEYGPTEATVGCVVELFENGATSVPIGRPIEHFRTHVLDADGELAPIGTAGELYIGGIGLARGYHERPALTAERFVPDSFGQRPGARLYRTGDLVRYRPDGVLEYLGRIDHQVKIRGFRVELGEIESQLLSLPAIRDAAVISRGSGTSARLVAYVIPTTSLEDPRSNAAELTRLAQTHLSKHLPDYMIPSAFVVLAALPLNANGKLDRARLPEPEAVAQKRYEAPRGAAEEALASIWAAVLRADRIGRDDNFFERGGDSILSLQIVSRARAAGWRITPRQMFERQSLLQLAAVAEPIGAEVKSDEESFIGGVPLLPIQSWFFEQNVPTRHHWNQSVLLEPRTTLRPDALDQALAAILSHHDALRLRYSRASDGTWTQFYAPETELNELLWLRDATDTIHLVALCEEAQRSLDLESGPVLRAVLLTLGDGSQRLLVAIHHLVVDGVSWRVLLEDLQTAYQQAAAGESIALPAKTTSFQRWSRYMQGYVSEHPEEHAFWEPLGTANVTLPSDRPQGRNEIRDQAAITLRLPRAQTSALLQDAPAAYRTQVNDLLLTALTRALCGWSGLPQLLVDLEGHGREGGEEYDLSRTVGWFTSLYPVRLDGRGSPGEALKRVKETLRQVPNKGLGYGAWCYSANKGVEGNNKARARATVQFNYLGQFDNSFDHASLWRPASEPAGSAVDPQAERAHEFTIGGQVYDGELRLNVGYSAQRYRRETVQSWVDDFQRELEALIAHCTSGAHGLTPSDFPLAQVTSHELEELVALGPEDVYPLSPMQQGLLFHTLQRLDDGAYVNQVRVDIEGLDAARFRQAWQTVFERHAILRAAFLYGREQPLQWIQRVSDVPLEELDWRDRDGDIQYSLDELAKSQHAASFDLSRPPLMRLLLVRTSQSRHHFIWTHHHLLMDGWSTAQLIGEVLHHYSGASVRSVAGGSYRDYIEWLSRKDTAASESYWRLRFRDLEEPTLLTPVFPASTAVAEAYREHVDVLDADLTARLEAFARRERITLNTLIQGAWALLLARYTGSRSVAFGVTTSGRPAELPGVEQLLGLFINTLPVITAPLAKLPVGDWLRDLQSQNVASREHEHTPLYEIQRWAGLGGRNLFDTLIVFENFPVDETLRERSSDELRFANIQHEDRTHYPITLVVAQGKSLRLCYGGSARFFEESGATTIASRVRRLLERLIADPQRHAGEIELLSDEDRSVLQAWGINARRFPHVEPVYRFIERQAGERPEALAVICGDCALTYRDLNARANRLARRLRRAGVGSECRVGIALERSIDMVIGVLAVLKAGGAYVPLDPDHPRERLAFILGDSRIGWVLGSSRDLERLPRLKGVLEIDASLAVAEEDDENLSFTAHPGSLAYVIYTSGSTGKPKGIGIPHCALTEHSQVAVEYFGLTATDRMLQFSTINFDGFVEQLFPPLCVGAGVVVRGPELWDSETFHRELLDKRITIADLPTMYWFLLAQDFRESRPRSFGALRQVQATGEAMPPEGIRAWHEAGLSHVKLLNTYGPTETTVTATAFDCAAYRDDVSTPPTQIPIGTPLAGRQAHVLDADLNPVIAGAVGELCIGGELLARGYWDRAGLSAERFVADPFSVTGARLYRTGDRVRWRGDGQLEYLGRFDHQVKIRGFRIELGEIESHLLALPGVREAVVVHQDVDHGARLVAYISAAAEDAELAIPALRERLAQTLPDYMVPSAIVVLDRLPLNPNGKLDRNRLPKADTTIPYHDDPPQGAIERAVAEVWCEVLRLGRVGRDDNFFDLGGHSLALLRAQGLIQSRLSVRLSLRACFEHARLRDLAAAISAHYSQGQKQEAAELDAMASLLESLGA